MKNSLSSRMFIIVKVTKLLCISNMMGIILCSFKISIKTDSREPEREAAVPCRLRGLPPMALSAEQRVPFVVFIE